MKVADKRAALKATVDRDINAPVKFKVGSAKIAAYGPLNIDDLEDADPSPDPPDSIRALYGDGDIHRALDAPTDTDTDVVKAIRRDNSRRAASQAYKSVPGYRRATDEETAQFVASLPDAPKDTTTVTITDAMSNPVPLYVHGVGSWSLRIGETYSLPVEAVSALRNSDVKFDEV